MEDTPEDDLLRIVESNDDEPSAEPANKVVRHPGARLAWENYLRCLFLMAVIFSLGFITWRPGALRLSLLLSMASPTRGESLAWAPEPDPLPPLREARRTPPPAEWRLGPSYGNGWEANHPGTLHVDPDGGRLKQADWRRLSFNPWQWSDDAGNRRSRSPEAMTALPPQKPATSFRAGNIAAWPTANAGLPPAGRTPTPGVLSDLGALPDLPPLPGLEGDADGDPFTAAPAGNAGGIAPLSPLVNLSGQTDVADAESASLPPPESPVSVLSPIPGVPSEKTAEPERPEPVRNAEPIRTPAASVTPTAIPTSPATAAAGTAQTAEPTRPAETVDWKNREIAGPIPGAYLTIYPKLKFVGLCVPGQGYIRKYNQVGVPSDLINPKMEAKDGRTPYGRYYVAQRVLDNDGPRLFLSWPSPEDAKRIGIDSGKLAEVNHAWQNRELPPQDSAAGGGVGLTGLRHWVETTDGGFALEAPQMEEIFTALPEKAWVFIQE